MVLFLFFCGLGLIPCFILLFSVYNNKDYCTEVLVRYEHVTERF